VTEENVGDTFLRHAVQVCVIIIFLVTEIRTKILQKITLNNMQGNALLLHKAKIIK